MAKLGIRTVDEMVGRTDLLIRQAENTAAPPREAQWTCTQYS